MPATTYTAAIGTASDVIEGGVCDVTVVENVVATYRTDDDGNETPEYGMSDKVAMPAQETTVRTDEDAAERLIAEAEQILNRNGWRVTGTWEPSDNAVYAPVERA